MRPLRKRHTVLKPPDVCVRACMGACLCECVRENVLSYLEHDSEENHNDRRGNKVVLGFDLLAIQQHHQGECHCPPQATVRHHHLIDLIQRDKAKTVQDPSLPDDTCSTGFRRSVRAADRKWRSLYTKWGPTHGSEDEDEDKSAGYQASVPGPLGLVHGGDTQEDENDGLCDAGEGLHGVLHRGPGLLGDVGLHIFICPDSTEGHPAEGNQEVSVYCTPHWTAEGVLTSKAIYTGLLWQQ